MLSIKNSSVSSLLLHLFYDEEEIYHVYPESLYINVRDYRYDLTIQVIQELLEFGLVPCHTDIKTVNSVFHFALLLLFPLSR